MPHLLPVRQRLSPTSRRTNSVQRHMRSRLPVLPCREKRAMLLGGANASGNATNSPKPFVRSSSTTSGSGTRCAGRCSTAHFPQIDHGVADPTGFPLDFLLLTHV